MCIYNCVGKTTKVHSTIFKDHLATFNLTEDDTIYWSVYANIHKLWLCYTIMENTK